MKFMENINKLQAVLTKLRREVQRSEAPKKYQGPKHEVIPPMRMDYAGRADPHWCFVCGKPADMGFGNALGPQRGYCRKHMPQRATGMVGERVCDECGGKFGHTCYHMGISKPTPDLPLNVKVAKALGYKVIRRQTGKWTMPRTSMEQEFIEYVPDYPNDLVAAMGALEEYCEKNDLIYKLIRTWSGQGYFGMMKILVGQDISVLESSIPLYALPSCNLPLCLCEAIVAHAEGK